MPPYDNTLQEVKDRIDIVDLISDYVNLKKAGQNWKGLCPFHSEKTPSFTVSPSKQIFHCFGCGAGGDIFTFIEKHESLTFPETLNILAKKAGVTLKSSGGNKIQAGEKETLLEIHRHSLSFFRHQLNVSPKAASYLKGRGVGKESIEGFSLGYAPMSWNALLNDLAKKGFKAESVQKAGLAVKGAKGYHDTFRDRIIFPIFDLKGDAVAFGGRIMDKGEPKYLNSPETLIFNKRKILYGLDRAKESVKNTGYALFMEGYLDVITAHSYGFTTAVAPLGTALTHEHGKLIKRFTDRVIIVFDSDEAGIKAAKNAAGILLESGINAGILSFPDKEDPDSFLRDKGREPFERLLDNPLSVVDFFLQNGKDRTSAAREVTEVLSRIQDRVLQGYYVKEMSEKLKLNEFFIIEEIKNKKKNSRTLNTPPARPAQAKSPAKPLNDTYLIKLMLQLNKKAGEISGILSVEDFTDPAARGIFSKIKDGFLSFNDLLVECEGEEKTLLTQISFEEDFENPEKALEDCLGSLRNTRRKILLKQIQEKIKEAELEKNHDLLKSLQAEHQKILKSGKV